jgi:hypothetical protein
MSAGRNSDMARSRVSRAQEIYGNVTYWVCVAATMLCTVGPVICIAYPENNVMNPRLLFQYMWEGKKPDQIWQSAVGGFPGGHYWLRSLGRGDGIIQFGLVLGCFSACLALTAASAAYVFEKPRQRGWALTALSIGVFAVLAALGFFHM